MEHDGPVLDIRTYRLVPGSGAEFDRIVRQHTGPMLARHGIRVLAVGPSLVGEDLYTLVRSFDSLEQRREQLEGFYGSDEWLERYDAAVMALVETYQTVVVEAPPGV